MAAAAVSTAASLALPRRADHARGPPSLRRRHCAVVRPLAAASSNPAPSGDAAECSPSPRRQVLVAGAAAAAALVSRPVPAAFAEGTKGFLGVIDRKAGYSFVYPFGWQEVSVQGQDKVYKDVIEPLESVSINMIPTTKEDIRDLGPPDQVAEALVRKVLAPPTQKTKLIEAKQDSDWKTFPLGRPIGRSPSRACFANSLSLVSHVLVLCCYPLPLPLPLLCHLLMPCPFSSMEAKLKNIQDHGASN